MLEIGRNTCQRRHWLDAMVSAIKGTQDLGFGIYNSIQQTKERDYLKDLQQQMFNRDDNAVQRRVRDLRAAGINPVLAAGDAAGNSGSVGSRAPQIEMDPVGKALSAIQMRKNIAQTEADTQKTIAEKKEIEERTGHNQEMYPMIQEAQKMVNEFNGELNPLRIRQEAWKARFDEAPTDWEMENMRVDIQNKWKAYDLMEVRESILKIEEAIIEKTGLTKAEAELQALKILNNQRVIDTMQSAWDLIYYQGAGRPSGHPNNTSFWITNASRAIAEAITSGERSERFESWMNNFEQQLNK